MKHWLLILLSALVLTQDVADAQSSTELRSREGELRRLRNEIDALEKKLTESERR